MQSKNIIIFLSVTFLFIDTMVGAQAGSKPNEVIAGGIQQLRDISADALKLREEIKHDSRFTAIDRRLRAVIQDCSQQIDSFNLVVTFPSIEAESFIDVLQHTVNSLDIRYKLCLQEVQKAKSTAAKGISSAQLQQLQQEEQQQRRSLQESLEQNYDDALQSIQGMLLGLQDEAQSHQQLHQQASDDFLQATTTTAKAKAKSTMQQKEQQMRQLSSEQGFLENEQQDLFAQRVDSYKDFLESLSAEESNFDDEIQSHEESLRQINNNLLEAKTPEAKIQAKTSLQEQQQKIQQIKTQKETVEQEKQKLQQNLIQAEFESLTKEFMDYVAKNASIWLAHLPQGKIVAKDSVRNVLGENFTESQVLYSQGFVQVIKA